MPKLTNTIVERFKGGQRIEKGPKAGELVQNPVLWDDTLAGFGVRYAMRSGTRTFIFKARVKGSGRELTHTIGRYLEEYLAEDKKPAVWTVDTARARAYALKGQMSSGHDPSKFEAGMEKIKQAKNVTLRQMKALYIENKRTKKGNRPLRPKTKTSINEVIDRNLEAWLDLPMAETITRDACVVRFTELSDVEFNQKTKKKGKHAAANLTFIYLRAICNYARDQYEDEKGNPLIFTHNPVSRMVKVRGFNEIKSRDERIPRDKIGVVWNALRARAADARTDLIRTTADWLSVAMLMGGRLTETGALLKANINLQDNTVLLPGSVEDVPGFHGTKNHRDLKLPLSTPLVEILTQRINTVQEDTPAARRRKRERDALYLFPSNGKVKPYVTEGRRALKIINEIAGGKKRITMHSLRRTFEDILMFAKVDPYQREILLNHINSGAHGASYANNREMDVLRPAMQAAADWVLEQARIASSPNVINFPVKQQA
jgi:hypothetical protein